MAREILNDDTFEVRETDLEDVVNPDAEVVYVLRPLSHAKVQAIRKRYPQDNQADLRSAAMLDQALVDWRGITNHGQPLPCERQYKSALPPDVVNAIGRVALSGRRTEEERTASFPSA